MGKRPFRNSFRKEVELCLAWAHSMHHPVKKFIRSTVTREFLAKEGWTDEIQKAREIAGFWEALDIMHSLEVKGLEIYFAFEGVVADAPGDFAVPLE